MTRAKQWFLRLGLPSAVVAGLLVAGSAAAVAQEYPRPRYERPASPVYETIHDLERLARRTEVFDSARERARYDNAIRHLSQFQNGFYRGAFDRGRLDQAISDVQNVIDHNPLEDRQRSQLWMDLSTLRTFRARNGYR
jgi:hypothetical protein